MLPKIQKKKLTDNDEPPKPTFFGVQPALLGTTNLLF